MRHEREGKVKWSVRNSCGYAVVLTYHTGTVRQMVVPCGRWACDDCARRRVFEVLKHIKAASGGGDIYSAEIAIKHWNAARKMAMRESAGYLSFKRFTNSTLLISDMQLRGRAWSLEKVSLDDLDDAILSQSVKRLDWCDAWRPEEAAHGVALGRVQCSIRDLPAILAEAGYDATTGRIPGLSPAETADRLREIADMAREHGKVPSSGNTRGRARGDGRHEK